MVDVTYTPHLHLSMLPANYRVWAQIMNNNLALIDAAISGFIQFQQFRGTWSNSTHYAVGDTVVDPTDATLWTSTEDHTSPQIPTTFLEDRTTNTQRWITTISPAHNRGKWTPETVYIVNDFVLASTPSGDKYAMCLVEHTSSHDFDADTVLGYWSILIDFSEVGSLVLPSLGGAVDANKFTGTNNIGTQYVNFNGIEAMNRLAGVLPVDKGGTGVTTYTGTTNNVLSNDAVMLRLTVSEHLNIASLVGGDITLMNINALFASSNTLSMTAGAAGVARTVTGAGGVLHEVGTNVNNNISDFNVHIWRTSAGASVMQLDTYTLSLFGSTSGFTQLKWPSIGTSQVLTFPSETGTIATREYVKGSGATSSFAPPAKDAAHALGGANVFVSGANTGSVGAAGERWLVFARVGIDQVVNSTALYYTTQIWNGSAAVDTQTVGVFLGSIVTWTSMFAIVQLSAPTTFTIRAASNTGVSGSLNGDSLIGAVRIG